MLSEISQTQRTSIVQFHIDEVSRTENRIMVVGAEEKRDWGIILIGLDFQLGKMEKFWRWMIGMIA